MLVSGGTGALWWQALRPLVLPLPRPRGARAEVAAMAMRACLPTFLTLTIDKGGA